MRKLQTICSSFMKSSKLILPASCRRARRRRDTAWTLAAWQRSLGSQYPIFILALHLSLD